MTFSVLYKFRFHKIISSSAPSYFLGNGLGPSQLRFRDKANLKIPIFIGRVIEEMFHPVVMAHHHVV